jgi:hypothetical protein
MEDNLLPGKETVEMAGNNNAQLKGANNSIKG